MESLRELWQYRPLIAELMRRDLKLRYKNSVGGIAWSLLNPLLQIFVITVVMKFIQARPISNYSAYLFGIIFLWNFFQVTLVDGCVSILQNAQLVRKVYFPRAILPLATLLANMFHFAVAFGFTILYLFVLGAYPHNLRLVAMMALPAIFFTAVLALGFTYILSYLNVFYEDVRFIVTAMCQLAFYTMPVFFTIEQVAAKGYYNLYMLNPVTALLVTYQRSLLPPPEVMSADGTALPPIGIPWDFLALAAVTSTIILVLGYSLFNKYQWEMAERL